MIKKIASIQTMAVFSDFKWDDSVHDINGAEQHFSQVNIMYGRNYSGKTTLSRIIRAFETGTLSEFYGTPSFSLATENATYTEADYRSKGILVRVFNDDFVRENLRFVIDPSDTIAPFAILGDNNDHIEKQIEQINTVLGSNENGSETGLYLKRASAYRAHQNAKNQHDRAVTELTKQKNAKATGRDIGIKYHSERFGNQNYTIRNLESDIAFVLSKDYTRPSDEQVAVYERTITEKGMIPPKEIREYQLLISQIAEKVKELCLRKVGQSQKIQELLSDIALQEWVRQGINQNKGRTHCAFCGSPLLDARWNELFSHFDEESEQLRRDIEDCLDSISIEEKLASELFPVNKDEFYAFLTTEVDLLINRYSVFANEYINALGVLRVLLKARKDNIYCPVTFSFDMPDMSDYNRLISEYGDLRKKNMQHSSSIASSKNKAQIQLRLAEVYSFIKTVDYVNQVSRINELAAAVTIAQEKLSVAEEDIRIKLSERDNLRRQQNDEEKGALRVNELLQLYFGHKYLSIVSKKDENEEGKSIYFEVIRNGQKAYHLSEGEKSLIAFCYFIAKLRDVETEGKKPIIWIDDPISSLDENHIYYVYSLITHEILARDNYDQLFITTHNLLFLKYLRKLDINKHNKSQRNNARSNFLIERRGKNSTIVVMPRYLKDHGTEFNRWFENIYYCSVPNGMTDDNIYLYESFGNNARKFFETYLYYRYPDNEKFDEHLKRFFGAEYIPPILIRKLEDENSHADGDLENHLLPFDEQEITEAAMLIIKRLEEIDKDQFNALMSYIKQQSGEHST